MGKSVSRKLQEKIHNTILVHACVCVCKKRKKENEVAPSVSVPEINVKLHNQEAN